MTVGRSINFWLLVLIAMLAFTVLACQAFTPIAPAPTRTPFPEPPDTSTWTLEVSDDFSESSRYVTDEYAHGSWFYQDGRYVIDVTTQNWLLWVTEPVNYADFKLEITVEDIPAGSSGGVVFRSRDGFDFYSFRVSARGSYILDLALGRENEEMQWQTLVSWTQSDLVDSDSNRLGVIAQGDDFWLFVNDELVEHMHDQTYTSGEIGVIAEHWDGEEGVRVYFDDLSIWTPGE